MWVYKKCCDNDAYHDATDAGRKISANIVFVEVFPSIAYSRANNESKHVSQHHPDGIQTNCNNIEVDGTPDSKEAQKD